MRFSSSWPGTVRRRTESLTVTAYAGTLTAGGGANMIRYVSGNGRILQRVAPLWRKLRAYHAARASAFAAEIATTRFGSREQGLLTKAGEEGLRIDIAHDSTRETDVGYCISSVDSNGQGEIDSLFVDRRYRGRNIGQALMHRALAWLRKKRVRRIIVGVATGNEVVFSFYARFGFQPRATILARPRSKRRKCDVR
jgi:ribosomal protein S18 acetylase RimI-like enzyme